MSLAYSCLSSPGVTFPPPPPSLLQDGGSTQRIHGEGPGALPSPFSVLGDEKVRTGKRSTFQKE